MFFEFDLPTNANVTKASSARKDMKLPAGIIHWVAIRFPPGPAGKVHVQIRQANHQLYPKDENEDIKGDDETVEFNEIYKLEPGLNTLTAYTLNNSVRHKHTPIIRFGVLQLDELFPEITLADLIKAFFRSFRRRS